MTRDRAFFLGILAVSLAAGVSAVARRERVVPEPQVTGRPIQVAGGGYVGSAACQACHPSQYASWHRSYHRTMAQVATPESVVARFDDVLERRGREIWSKRGTEEGRSRDGAGTQQGRSGDGAGTEGGRRGDGGGTQGGKN